jgi:uncharacterized protein DUF2846
VGLEVRVLKFAALAVCLAVQSFHLAGCAAPAALESQAKQRDARLARLYFLREKSGTPSTEIKVDGTPVGTVVGGTYFFVDRPPGTYKLSAASGLSMAYEAVTRVEAGQTYYFGVGVPQVAPIGQNLLNQALAGSSGQQMQSTSPLMGGFSAAALYQFDPAAGAAVIAQLKAQ